MEHPTKNSVELSFKCTCNIHPVRLYSELLQKLHKIKGSHTKYEYLSHSNSTQNELQETIWKTNKYLEIKNKTVSNNFGGYRKNYMEIKNFLLNTK